MRRRDIIIAGIFLFTALGLWWINRAFRGGAGTQFTITLDGRVVLQSSLLKDGVYPITQIDGSYNVIEVKDGSAFMREANCRDGLCLRQGKTNTPAKSIVCLPHRLTVSVLNSNESNINELDIIVQ